MSFRKTVLLCTILCAALWSTTDVHAQRVGIKTNLLYWATLSPNIGTEFRLSRHFTVNLEAAGNPFKFGDHQLHFASFMPEVRYWFSARPQAGHFLGVMTTGTMYDLQWKEKIHTGDAIGAGLTYGYSFVLKQRLSLEATAGVGLLHTRDKSYRSGEDAPAVPNQTKTQLMPLKIGLTLTYLLK